MGSLYRSQHELVFVFKSGTGGHTNDIELGKDGRNRTNVWNYDSAKRAGPQKATICVRRIRRRSRFDLAHWTHRA